MLMAGEDAWIATRSSCSICNNSNWELANSWLLDAADGCWIVELCFSYINVRFSIVYNCEFTQDSFGLFFFSCTFCTLKHRFLCFESSFVYAEFGDPDKECWIYAILSLPFHLPNEHLVPHLWNLKLWCLHLCKSPSAHKLLVVLFKPICSCKFRISLSYLYLLISHASNFQVPNGMGTILGIAQLLLYFYYNNSSREDSKEPLIVSYA